MSSSPVQRIITLTTDFGASDEYVGVMKGVILCVNPHARMVDISHGIEPENIMEAAFLIYAAFRHFPRGTLHVAVVDPGVGTDRAVLCLETEGHVFLAPDNGLLTLLLENNAGRLIRMDTPAYHATSICPTFHGRDIFAPLAGRLSNGAPLEKIGAPFPIEQAFRLTGIHPLVKDGPVIEGRVVWIDRFGNLITNIPRALLESRRILSPALRVRIGAHEIRGLSRTYADAPSHAALALIGSRGFLEIAVNGGSACSVFQVKSGQDVFVRDIHR